MSLRIQSVLARNTEDTKYPLVDAVSIEACGGVESVWVDATCPEGFAGDESIVYTLGEVCATEYLAIVLHSPFWCSPFFGHAWSEMPASVQMVLAHAENGSYRCILPVCADTFKTALRGTERGIEAVVSSNCKGLTACRRQLSLVTAEGEDPHSLVRLCAEQAAKLLGNGLLMREEREMPEVLEYLGWCSWDALQYRISHEGLLLKAREFAEKKVPVHYAILDDMWADIPDFATIPEEHTFRELVNIMHQSRIRTFDGDPIRFPKGMKAAIDDLRAAGIPTVGLWYPTTGYWKGYYEDSDLVREHPECFMVANSGKWHKEGERIVMVKPEEKSADGYFDAVAERAKSWGVDFVKVDNQGYHKHYRDLYPIGQRARAIHRAIDRSADKHFGGAIINCMGMASECMFNRPTSAVSRCSDDFMPESREWFAKYILQCAYNGLLQGQYYINDWDMFWTDDEQAAKNSLCRAISGGPIYVSDKIGRTRPEVLRPLTLSDGRILRPDHSAMPTADCVTSDPRTSHRPLKIFNRVGEAGIVALFNVDENAEAVRGTLSVVDARLADGDYVYYEYFTGACGILRGKEAIDVTLSDRDTFRLYTLVPLQKNGVTLLGRCDKYVGIKAIESVVGNTVTFREGGKIGFYSETPVAVRSERRVLEVVREGNFSYVVADPEEKILNF